jgi:maltose O-acetyltransferase
MTEFEKMRHEEFYDFTNEEGLASYNRAKHICAKLQMQQTQDISLNAMLFLQRNI